jgi:predicted CoA-binding protein
MTAGDALRDAKTVLLIDFPSREVPDSLARAGYEVVVQGGPKPEDYFGFTAEGDHVSERRLGLAPEHADIVYVYRPAEELAEIVEKARQIRATVVWCESGSDVARRIVEDAGFVYVDSPSIVEAVRG